ncbi:LexA repressor [Streptomyces sp. C]|nr:LexA repressor [Streptomyces sp. C]
MLGSSRRGQQRGAFAEVRASPDSSRVGRVAFIEQTVARKGYPPSMREIGEGVRLRSTSSVAHQLMALEREGLLYRDPHRPRA